MEKIIFDKSNLGKFLEAVIKKAMIKGSGLILTDIHDCAHDVKLISDEEFLFYFVKRGFDIGFEPEKWDSAVSAKINSFLSKKQLKIEDVYVTEYIPEYGKKSDYSKEDAYLDKKKKVFGEEYARIEINLERVMRILIVQVETLCVEITDFVYTINPNYFFNVVGLDEFRFAQKSAKKALFWTRIGFWASSIIGTLSFLVSYYAYQETKQSDKLQQQIEKLTKRLDSLQKKK